MIMFEINIFTLILAIVAYILSLLIISSIVANHNKKENPDYIKITFSIFVKLYKKDPSRWNLNYKLLNPKYMNDSSKNASCVYFSTIEKFIYWIWRFIYKDSLYNYHKNRVINEFSELMCLEYDD